MNAINLRIQKARKYAGLTQSELAGKLGIGRRSMQRYETDTNTNISVDSAVKIAEICSVNSSWLVFGTGNIIPDESDDKPDIPDIDKENIDLVLQFKKKTALKNALKGLLELEK